MSRALLLELLLDLAWAQWTALGVAGTSEPTRAAVDLEALLILTSELAEEDPRLRDESLDWCSTSHRFLSKPRLKQLLRRSSESAQQAFAPYAGSLDDVTGESWPGAAGSRRKLSLSGKSSPPRLDNPALVHLRLRALFGVGARADIIGATLSRAAEEFGAADLVYVGYTKRNIAAALDSLASGGLFRTMKKGNRLQYSWQRHHELSALLTPLPEVIPRWPLIIRLLSEFLSLLTRVDGKSPRVYVVEATRLLLQLTPALQELGLTPPAQPLLTAQWIMETTARLTVGAGLEK